MTKPTSSRNRYQRRTNKPVTSSSKRATRVKGAQTARKTGSPDKMTRSGGGTKGSAKVTTGRGVKTNPPVSGRGAQGPRNPPVQGPSRRTPSAIGGDTGRTGGKNQPAKPKSNVPRPQARGDRFASSSAKAGPKPPSKTAQNAVRDLGTKAAQNAARSLGTKALLAAGLKAAALFTALEGAAPAKAADGTLKGKPSRPNNQKPKATPKPKAKEPGAAAKDFDRAFAAARKEGKKEFTWRGKRYNTKLK